MRHNFPFISVVLNVYNESEHIESCLHCIRSQIYPQKQIEIIVVDDNSTDNTVELVKPFDVRIVRSGHRNRERAKSIGIEQAHGEFILLMDADVFLLSSRWIDKSVNILLRYPNIVGVQNIQWHYRKKDHIVNRYCNLFGVNDPVPFFLGKRGALMATEKDWPYKNTIVEKHPSYVVAQFTIKNLPTIGAQGYMVRRKDILKTSWKPYFFHMDTAFELVAQGKNQFAMVKLAIEHRYAQSIAEFYTKLYRNLTLYLQLKRYRKYHYETSNAKFFTALLLMFSIVYPFSQSIRGYMKKRDIAWFLHPLFSFTVPIMYAFVMVVWHIKHVWSKNTTTS